MKFEQLVKENGRQLESMGIDLRELDTLKFGPKETLSHRVTKLILCHLLRKAGHHFKTEQPINKAICDVIDLDTFVVYEIESYANSTTIKKKLDDYRHPFVEDLFILDLRKLKLNWTPIYDLKDRIKQVCCL